MVYRTPRTPNHPELREKINGGDWSDETQKEVPRRGRAFANDFGYDLDEEGQPLGDDGRPSRPSRASRPRTQPASRRSRRRSAAVEL